MKILWITHDIFEACSFYVKGNPSKGRPWVAPLFYNINNRPDVELGALTPVVKGAEQQLEIEGVTYYTIPIDRKDSVKDNIGRKLADKFINAINNFSPDIIHVHGTEINFGLLRKYVDRSIPIVCSIQGIIPPCSEFLRYSVADTDIQRHRSIKNRLGRGGINHALRKWGRYVPKEKEIFRINQYFIGRTWWDKAYLSAYNPEAFYYHGEELLRPAFYESNWSLDTCERHRVFISSSAYAIKGFHILVKAAAILKNKYPDIKIVAPLSSMRTKSSKLFDFLFSEDYNNYLKKEIAKAGLEHNIILLKNLDAKEMSTQFQLAHVFALPSFIENSPNSLGEAMMVGTPSVVAPVGGVTSIVKDEEDALLFPSGDYVALAHKIDRLFSDDELAQKLSKNGKAVAEKRHHIAETTQQYLDIYSEIINKHSQETFYT